MFYVYSILVVNYRTIDSIIGTYWKGMLPCVPMDPMVVLDMVSFISFCYLARLTRPSNLKITNTKLLIQRSIKEEKKKKQLIIFVLSFTSCMWFKCGKRKLM